MDFTQRLEQFVTENSLGYVASSDPDGSSIFDVLEHDGSDTDSFEACGEREEFENPCPPGESFAVFRQTMQEVNNKLYKKIIKQGSGDVIDLDHKRVSYQYASFAEGQAKPFATSRSAMISLQEEIEPLPGYCLSLATMKFGEEAVFWISSDYATVSKGVAGIVSKSAGVLFRCSIINVSDPQIKAEFDLTSFFQKVSSEMIATKSSFKAGNFAGCIDVYSRLIDKLENVKISCDEDDVKRNNYLVKLYQNIIVCYNKTNQPRKTCIMIRDLERLTDITSNPVVLFAKGKANMLLDNFDHAEKFFRMAQRVNKDREFDHEIYKTLELMKGKKLLDDAKLLMKRQQLTDKENDIRRREMMATETKQRKEIEEQSELETFRAELQAEIHLFKKHLRIENTLLRVKIQSKEHEEVAEEVCQASGVTLRVIRSAYGQNTFHFLHKEVEPSDVVETTRKSDELQLSSCSLYP